MSRVSATEPTWPYFRWLLLAAAFGIIGAMAAEAFRHTLDVVTAWLFGRDADITVILGNLSWGMQLAVPTLGGALAGLILVAANRYQQKHDMPAGDYLEAIDGRMASIPAIPSLLRCLSSFFSILSGGSVGKEGAMVQLSSTVASLVAVRHRALSGERYQLMIAVSAAGGLAAVYHTPLAAAIFVAEIAFGGIEYRRLALLFTGAVASTAVIMVMGLYQPLYPMSLEVYQLDAATLAATVGVGFAAGLGGLALLLAIRHARRVFARVPGGPVARMTLGGLVVGGIVIIAPDVAGNGFFPLAQLLSGHMLGTALLALLALKIVATAATVGSGAVGGLFTPALLVGALTGISGTALMSAVFGVHLDPALYGVVGMASALAATTQAPLMSALMAVELTQQPALIFPIMLATVVAYGTPHLLGQAGAYPIMDRHRHRHATRSQLHDMHVADAMQALDVFVRDTATLAEARELAMQSRRRFVFVLDSQDAFVGAVRVHDLIGPQTGGDITDRPLTALIERDFPMVLADDRLLDVWQIVVTSPAERVPVLADRQSRRVVGVLPKSEILDAAGRTLV